MSFVFGLVVGYALRHFAHDRVKKLYNDAVDYLNKRNAENIDKWLTLIRWNMMIENFLTPSSILLLYGVFLCIFAYPAYAIIFKSRIQYTRSKTVNGSNLVNIVSLYHIGESKKYPRLYKVATVVLALTLVFTIIMMNVYVISMIANGKMPFKTPDSQLFVRIFFTLMVICIGIGVVVKFLLFHGLIGGVLHRIYEDESKEYAAARMFVSSLENYSKSYLRIWNTIFKNHCIDVFNVFSNDNSHIYGLYKLTVNLGTQSFIKGAYKKLFCVSIVFVIMLVLLYVLNSIL